MKILDGIKPESVFKYFEDISSIPRGSKNTDKIRDYCVRFAEERNLEYITDEFGNVIIFKSANKKLDSEPVIIQGHLDMVWEKDENCAINFETDGIELIVDGDFISANGTTLGADDGIAVAMCLALLDSDNIIHPPLEIVLTSDEEVGMTGAEGIDTSVLNSKRMINLDSEQEGVLWVSCAGGIRADIEFCPILCKNTMNTYKISISNLHGGHSGAEIHKGYANANKVMGRVLKILSDICEFNICSIEGGLMYNAITRESSCIVASNENVPLFINNIYNELSAEYVSNDPDMKIFAEKSDAMYYAFSKESTDNFIDLLNELPYGVISMSDEIEGLVETSLNIGVIKTNNNKVTLGFSIRSGKDNKRDKLCDDLSDICKKYFCSIIYSNKYPAWEFKKESILRDKMSAVYREIYNKDMLITAIHAGLECGLFCGKKQGLDCVSLGPDIFDIHTPKEKLCISSTERVWDFLLKVLEVI